MAVEIRDPKGDTGTGAEITAIGTWRHKTAQDLVTYVVEVETGTTAETAMREGAMVQTPTPLTKTGRKTRAADRPVAKEVGQRRWNNGLGDGENL